MATLGSANPHFVRCIKPNIQKKPDQFEHQVVLNQLKYSGQPMSFGVLEQNERERKAFNSHCVSVRLLYSLSQSTTVNNCLHEILAS